MAFLLAGSANAYSQTLELEMDPAKCGGYTAWDGGAVSATVSVYEKVGSVYNLVNQETTSKKYARINPRYFNSPNYYYKIVITKPDLTTDETIYVPAVPIGYTGPSEIARKKCNGRWYAYDLVAYEITPGTTGIYVDGANNYYDAANLLWVPYYQAIDATTWSVMSSVTPTHPVMHPYASGALGVYDKRALVALPHGSGYYDRNGAGVSNGWLIEKKYDEFNHFDASHTLAAADFPDISVPLTGMGSSWIGFFNSHIDGSSYNGGSFPTVPGPFATTVPTGLECVAPYLLPPDPVLDSGSNWNDWVTEYKELVHDLESAIGVGGGGVTTKDVEDMIHTVFIDSDEVVFTQGVNFRKYKSENYINLTRSGNGLEVYNATTIPAGLYEVTVYSNTDKILPLYIDVKYPIPFAPLKDYASILITPNPIIANDLTLNIKNSKPGNVTVRLYDMNNTLLHTDAFNMTAKELNKHYDITSYTLPSNQIIVKVSFADNSYLTTIGTE